MTLKGKKLSSVVEEVLEDKRKAEEAEQRGFSY